MKIIVDSWAIFEYLLNHRREGKRKLKNTLTITTNNMNMTLTKRKYESLDEMAKDFWANHSKQDTCHKMPQDRLLELMHRDGQKSIAWNLWNNQWHLLNTNSGRCWLPTHGKTLRRLFPASVKNQG